MKINLKEEVDKISNKVDSLSQSKSYSSITGLQQSEDNSSSNLAMSQDHLNIDNSHSKLLKSENHSGMKPKGGFHSPYKVNGDYGNFLKKGCATPINTFDDDGLRPAGVRSDHGSRKNSRDSRKSHTSNDTPKWWGDKHLKENRNYTRKITNVEAPPLDPNHVIHKKLKPKDSDEVVDYHVINSDNQQHQNRWKSPKQQIAPNNQQSSQLGAL